MFFRGERYKVRAQIQREASGFDNKEEYWRSLGMTLYFHPLSATNTQRVLQLLAKTNQFNMTTKRYSEIDLNRLAGEQAAIIALGLSDRYSEHEIIGVAILELPGDSAAPLTIDSFLLSCRVLGRGVEKGVLGWICAFAEERGYKTVRGLFHATERNLPASTVYAENGFLPGADGSFLLDLETSRIAIPNWFTTEKGSPE